MTPASCAGCCIGVFDSGVGGLSVLPSLRAALPGARLLYVADSGHAPYGERSEDFIVQRSLHIAAFLRAQGAQLLVVACNTATAAAVEALRQAHGDIPVVGIEPGVKPAVALTRNGRVGVMATAGTLSSRKFQRLLQAQPSQVSFTLHACTGLALAIERGDLGSAELQAVVRRHCAPLREAGCDVVVLGCTHYPFAAPLIRNELPGVTLVDTAQAVARHTAALAARLPASTLDLPPLQLWSSGEPAQLDDFMQRWLQWPAKKARVLG
ncbi:glutamate racemase [Azohydromonas caseinilytica]|uniref:Glutamate racemase n=1 Tax=Azohydromonas caseinilytica TaxID=2728836 RepID=A0A848F6R7_9BURK|nr:glutamate racemase [Azohydromonas caseinilytica]NML14259.1 glutamate racemase [Azohydromonas caseinilytica]